MQSPMLSIRLLGPLELRRGDELLPELASARAESLLSYLVLHQGVPQTRQRLAFLLWPDSSESQARTNLRHVLHDLRHALPEADRYLDVTSRTLQWRSEAPVWLDVAAFADALTVAGENGSAGDLDALREAIALYRGDLLEDHYDDWLMPERERLRGRYLEALERLATLLAERGAPAEAIAFAERLSSVDPLHEAAYRLLMRLHAARGQPARALQTFHLCSATLERELGIEPSPATRQVYETLLPTGRADAPETIPRIVSVGGSALVGRMPEWTRLTTLWRETERSRAQLVLASGEPGAGKSRLVEELRRWCERRRAVTAAARSYAAEGAMTYGPLVTWLRSPSFASRLNQLDRASRIDLAVLLPDLLPSPETAPPPDPVSETNWRQRLFMAAARAIHAAGAPVLLVADDLQWCDAETLSFLHYLLRVDPDFPLLIAATARREEIDHHNPINALIARLRTLECFSEIELGRLSEEETALLVERLGGHPLSNAAAARLFRETEGNPLFVVEAVRAGWDGRDEAVRLSPKAQAVIEDRLAQLSDAARDLVGLAATVGREFTPDVLAAASEAGEETLVGALDELWRRRIVREHGADAYDFSHDKIREVAYLALSPARRRHFHFRVASALERLCGADPGAVSSQIAAHFERAGVTQQAITWYAHAAEAAQQRYANVEAIRLLDRALDLLGALPVSAARQEQELAILAALVSPLGTVEGWGSERLGRVQQRARELAGALGLEPASPLLRSLAIASLSRHDFGAARNLGEHLRHRGERDADELSLVEGEYVLGIVAFWQGELETARRHFVAAIDRYRPELRRAHLLQYGLDPKVICWSRLANTLWFLGYAEAAVQARDAALALADEIAHPFSRTVALVFATLLSLDMRDVDSLRVFYAKVVAEHAEYEMKPNQTAIEHFSGYLDVCDGRVAQGIARIRSTLDEARQVDHAPGMRAYSVHVLLAAHAVAGDAQSGLAAADWALALGGDDRLWEAEIRRLRAEFLGGLDAPVAEIAAELDRALQVARRQGARALELRVACSMLGLRRRQGDERGEAAARDALRAILAAMPEGRDTRDFREAASLLQ